MSSTIAAVRRIDSEALQHQLIAMAVGFGPQLGRMDIVQLGEMLADAERLEHPARRRVRRRW